MEGGQPTSRPGPLPAFMDDQTLVPRRFKASRRGVRRTIETTGRGCVPCSPGALTINKDYTEARGPLRPQGAAYGSAPDS